MRCDWAIFENVYTDKECLEIIETVKLNKTDKYIDSAGSGKRVHTILAETTSVESRLDRFFNLVYQTNEIYFGFDLYNHRPWVVHLNEYNQTYPEYPYHKDATVYGSCSDIKLTAIINLSPNAYTGGEFQLFTGEHVNISAFSKQGSVIIFPSFIYHRVLPILSGDRITLSTWLSGNNFK